MILTTKLTDEVFDSGMRFLVLFQILYGEETLAALLALERPRTDLQINTLKKPSIVAFQQNHVEIDKKET